MRNYYSGCGVSKFLVPAVLSLSFFYLILDVLAVQEQYAVAGRRASIPCNISDSKSEDTITLILWYKGEAKSPIYTVDARKGPLEKARHFPANDLNTRAVFDVSIDPAILYLEPVLAEDDGIYMCRTEFKRTRTETDVVRLHVAVPPHEVIIMDEFGQRLKDVIGPYDEGSRVTLLCEAEGIPPPTVTWWKDNELIDDTFAHTTQGYVRNELVLTKIQKSELLTSYTCQAANTNLSAPVSSSVYIDMNLRPLDVRITTMQRPLSATKKVQLKCESWGARPKTQLTWMLDGKKIQNGKEIVSENLTTSVLPFIPLAEDNGKILTCRARNPMLESNVIENGWTLNIHFVPELKLSLGANIQPKAIREGSDVFFECYVTANPPANEVKWFFEDHPLVSNAANGIIISNISLVLQKVRKEHRGKYQCGAVNSEGEGRSREVMLRIRYAPVCRNAPTAVHGVARDEVVNATCDVEADPADVEFKWTLNNTVEIVDVPAYVINGTLSTVTYTPGTMFGYGVLHCWGTNSVGIQKEPCVIRIIPAGPPESVKGCIVSNQSISSLSVECEPGYDGGIRQTFHLEVYNSVEEHLHTNVSSTNSPIFVVGDLPSSSSFILVLYSSNAKGKSSSVALMASTSHLPERRTNTESDTESGTGDMSFLSPVLAIFVSITVVVVCIALAMIIIAKRHVKHKPKGPSIEEDPIKYDMPLKKDFEDIPDSTVESPDVIPNTTETSKNEDDLVRKVISYEYPKSRERQYDHTSTLRPSRLSNEREEEREMEKEITYVEIVHKDVPFSERIVIVDSPTDYAELDFKQRLEMAPCTRVMQKKECSYNSEDVLNYPFLSRSPRRSKESLSIPETTTETTPL